MLNSALQNSWKRKNNKLKTYIWVNSDKKNTWRIP